LYQSWGKGKPTAKASVGAWYSEYDDCGPLPGCKGGASGVTGHFTAMQWNGAQEIGCSVNSHNLVACRYKGSDSPTCRTPNMGGEYKSNVFAKVRTLEQCTALVDQCGIGSGGCGGDSSLPPVPIPAPEPVPVPAPEPARTPRRRGGSATAFVGCGEVYQGSQCGKKHGGWTCPPEAGCPGGDCTGEWKEFVKAHNVYRCMHDASSIVWNEAVYQDALKTFKDAEDAKHSDSYSLKAPVGPAGENLFKASWAASAEDVVGKWYAEIEDCGALPGCKAGSTGTTGHFTVMMWNGAQEIGCAMNKHNVAVCRYKGSDEPGCRTPNMHGHFVTNVFPAMPVRSLDQCKSMVEQCSIGAGGCSAGVDTPAPTPAACSRRRKKGDCKTRRRSGKKSSSSKRRRRRAEDGGKKKKDKKRRRRRKE